MNGAFLRQALVLCVLALVPAFGQALVFRDRVSWNAPAVAKDEVELAQVRAWEPPVLWVDARPDAQYEADHIPGAILLNEDRWNELLPLVQSKWVEVGMPRIVVYCSSQSCAASHEVAKRLRETGMPAEIWVLHGGWEAFLESRQ